LLKKLSLCYATLKLHSFVDVIASIKSSTSRESDEMMNLPSKKLVILINKNIQMSDFIIEKPFNAEFYPKTHLKC